MTITKFVNNPLIKEFNGLKRFFRKYETDVSKERILDFKHFTSMINSSGDKVAFDLLGSVNFGQAERYSDADVIIYLDCDEPGITECGAESCEKYKLYKKLLMNTLVYEYANNTYKVEFVDCINLRQLERDIIDTKTDSFTIVKFAFYRSICRGINRSVLRYYENLLMNNEELCDAIETALEDCFRGLTKTSQHSYSFRKYMERLEHNKGFKVPESVAQKVKSYLWK
ncbi:MAG: hypothetical protein H7A25_23520 [Leptospiraceae bacterium]|nr:hypothetical protein [Leptospiraceae bacterium]MCP5502890.1 hypothetical protein [Leptospiraceae bacterium]